MAKPMMSVDEKSAMVYANRPDFFQGIPSNPDIRRKVVGKDRYTSRRYLEREAERLWPKVWQMVCREEELAEPGDYFEYRILDQSILVVRQEDGGLASFYNACRHRGTQLALGCGNTPEFRCPYHGWTYNLDGSLRFVQSPNEFPCSSEFDYSLQPCLVDKWGGFVFINFDLSAQPLLDYLAPAPEYLEEVHFEHQQLVAAVTCVLPCNWKAAFEAFNEAYHVPFLHPQAAYMSDDTSARLATFGIHSREISDIGTPSKRLGEVSADVILEAFYAVKEDLALVDDAEDASASIDAELSMPDGLPIAEYFSNLRREAAIKDGWDVSGIESRRWQEVHSWMIFPNLVLSSSIGDTIGWRALPNGMDPDSCLLEYLMFRWLPADQSPSPPKREFYADWRDYECGMILHDQDFPNLERVQRGLHSRAHQGNIYSEIQEAGLFHLHEVLDSYIET